MSSITINLPPRRTVLLGLGLAVLSAGIVGGAFYARNHDSSAPTTSVAGGPANSGCVDEAGTATRSLSEWYTAKTDGEIALHGELVNSLYLGVYNGEVTRVVANVIGHFASSQVRDNAENPSACTNIRYANYDLDDGGQIQVTAWRVEQPANPNTLPNEGSFVQSGDDALVSTGPHAITTLVVAPDGTTVMVAGYGKNALAALTSDGITNTIPTDVGPAPATAEQLLTIGHQVLGVVLERVPLES